MTQREKNAQPEGIAEYRARQTGWRADSSARGPKVNLDKLYDFVFDAIESGRHPIQKLADTSRGTKITLGAVSAILITGAGANYYASTPQWQTPQGVEEVNQLGKNVDDLSGVEASRVKMYVAELPGVFSEQGKEQLRIAALQSDDPPFVGGGDLSNSQRGLDAMIVLSQMIDGHDLGNGRFLEFQEDDLANFNARLGDFVGSGLASSEIKDLHESGDTIGAVSYLRELPQNREAGMAALRGSKTVELNGPVAGQSTEGLDQGR